MGRTTGVAIQGQPWLTIVRGIPGRLMMISAIIAIALFGLLISWVLAFFVIAVVVGIEALAQGAGRRGATTESEKSGGRGSDSVL